MFLPWLDIEVHTVHDALWYILRDPPPKEATFAERLALKVESPPQVLRAESLWNSPPPRLFALLIGINEYADPSVNDLKGCVADVNEMQAFLENTLCVPRERIQVLLNQDAVREEIINHIRDLASNPDLDIQPDDPILIFYAGHGSEAKFARNVNEKIQMLLPHNFVYQKTDDKSVQGILDVELGALLAEICAVKGDNITVILDTCHSGSGTRDEISECDLMVRAVELPEDYRILSSIDDGTLSKRGAVSSKGFSSPGLASHVLLAACREDQIARETRGRGVFSRELLQLLQIAGADKLTYKEAIERLPDLPMQNPQCEGVHNQRCLFDGKVPATGRVLYPVHLRGKEVVLQAGEAHGVTRGAQFELLWDQHPDTPGYDGFIVSTTTAFDSVVQRAASNPDFLLPTFNLGRSGPVAWALQTRMGEREDIRVYIPLTDRFIDLFHHIALQMQAGTIMMGIRLVEENEPADLILRLEENEPADLILHFEGGERGNLSWVSFEPMDSTCQDYGLKRIPHAAPLEVQPIYFVLASAARFHWHLSHSSSQEKLAVTFKCTKLGEDTSKPYEYTNKPILVPQGDNLVKAGEITVDLDDRPSVGYGFKITNNCEYPLYAALFYFDMSDLSISPIYLPPHAKDQEAVPSILVRNSLTIGYGPGGWAPARFELPKLPKNRIADVDIGYLKLFISTKYVDHSHMMQATPFGHFRGLVMVAERPPEMWDTVKFAVVLRKQAGSI